ncbi:nuclease domain-containing protein [Pseudomonas sp. dw_358]|uniref:nuclease domain-containing protein n=1 Tax=Pseudomonas sp. dw_358 TaxID=2720083 RepID=UPI001BD43DC2|nr:nuclease domain-containing protein [Pseudomonas sp. dw_358]
MRVVSQKLRDSARDQECTLRFYGICNRNPETTVLAHVPCGQKGMGMKGPDQMSCFACSDCHDALDGRKRVEVDFRDVIRAVAETQAFWISKGLMKVQGVAA